MSEEVSSAPQAPAATPPTAADVAKAADTMSSIDLDALLGESPGHAVHAAPAAPPPAVPASIAEPPAPPEPPAEPGDEDFPKNIRVHVDPTTPEGRKDAAFYLLSKEIGPNAAHARIYGAEAAKPAPVAAPPAPEPAAEIDTKITAAQTELTTIRAKIDKAIDEGDTKAQADALIEFQRQERKIERLSDEKAAVAHDADTQENNIFRQKAGEASRQAIAEFPQFAGPLKAGEVKSAERKGLEDFIVSKREDPDYESVFLSPRWPLILARDYASARGLRPAAGATPPPTAPNARVTRAPAAEVLTSAPGSAAFTATRESLLKAVDDPKISVAALDALLGIPTPRRA